jgi:hypothetical protein
MIRFWQVRNRDKRWFEDIRDIAKFIGKYEYFGSFHFEKNHNPSFDDASKSISHFRNVIRKQLFGQRGSFDMNFLSVIEDEKWNTGKERYEPVDTHFHFLINEPPDDARLNKDFGEFLIDSWCSLEGMDEKENQHITPIYSKNPVVDENGKIIYAPSAEEYITKLRHSKKGIRWFDTKNSNQSSPIPYDEDALDYISSFYENVKRQPDKYQTLGTGLDV